jgi:7-carboxy-7-deazaguanine synthase
VTYLVKEVFYTLQGEGAHAGRPAVFCRFSACNLWTGREADRGRAVCSFCDTDFVGGDGTDGGRYDDAATLADVVAGLWPAGTAAHRRFVVCTGGEPLLQLDPPLIEALHGRGFSVAVETNGTIAPPHGVDWLCVSPKTDVGRLAATAGDELKLVFPQAGLDPSQFERLRFTSYRLQPMDGQNVAINTLAAVEYCLSHPLWSLSLQTHKTLGLR